MCSNCHVPHDWTDKIARKMQASKEVWGKIFGTIDTREKFSRQAARARPARMGALQGQRLARMPQLPQLRVHGLHAPERARAEHALDLPGEQGEDLHRLPQGHRAQTAAHSAGSRSVADTPGQVVPQDVVDTPGPSASGATSLTAARPVARPWTSRRRRASAVPRTHEQEIRMQALLLFWRAALLAVALLGSSLALAADYPTPKEADWTASDFRFHTGEVMPALRIHYTTIGPPSGEPVLVLHGTAGSGTGMLTPAFAGELFGAGPAARRDAGTSSSSPTRSAHGKSAKPSDGLRAKFPRYNYDDMVARAVPARHRGTGHPPPQARDRQLDGRHACLALGRQVPRVHGRRWCRWRASRPRCRAATG